MLETEKISRRYKGIDTWPAEEAAMAFWEGQVQAVTSVRAALSVIAGASVEIARRLSENKNSRLVYVGAGTSGLLAMQDAMELTPTYGFPLERIVFCMAGGDAARLRPTGVPEDDITIARHDFTKEQVGSDDVIIAVAASGNTPYTLEFIKLGQKNKALVVSITNNENAPLLEYADFPIFLNSGREVVAGSTRLNAGTAQKGTLSILSSMTFMKMGHVVDGMMISVIADNAKLVERAASIVERIAEVDNSRARQAMEAAEGSVKLGTLIALGCEKDNAKDILEKTGGDLRQAMSLLISG